MGRPGPRLPGKPLQDFSSPRPIAGEIFDSPTVLISGELDKMADAPLYPSYAWIPRDDTFRYEVEVWQQGGGDAKTDDVRKAVYQIEGAAILDPAPFRQAGSYFWRVRPFIKNGRPEDGWSEPQFFTVNPPEAVRVAALGDSITHGGSLAAPPCYRMYTFMDYCPVPIKNLGRAGDTTEDLVNRFQADVLPFFRTFSSSAGESTICAWAIRRTMLSKTWPSWKKRLEEGGSSPSWLRSCPSIPCG